MRVFSTQEQDIIKSLFTPKNNGGFILNYIFEQQRSETWLFNRTEQKIELVFPFPKSSSSEHLQDISARIDKLQIMILEIGNLLNYLESQGLICVYSPFEQGSNERQVEVLQGDWLEGSDRLHSEFHDKFVNGLILKYFNKKIHCTFDLDILIKNNFVSQEDLRLNKSLTLGKWGIAVAILLGIINITFNIIRIIYP
jgi:hypothetical protein